MNQSKHAINALRGQNTTFNFHKQLAQTGICISVFRHMEVKLIFIKTNTCNVIYFLGGGDGRLDLVNNNSSDVTLLQFIPLQLLYKIKWPPFIALPPRFKVICTSHFTILKMKNYQNDNGEGQRLGLKIIHVPFSLLLIQSHVHVCCAFNDFINISINESQLPGVEIGWVMWMDGVPVLKHLLGQMFKG